MAAQALIHSILLLLFFFFFFFSSSCGSTKIDPADLNVLLSIRNSLTDIPGGDEFFSTWDFTSSSDPCSSFSGVTCNTQGRVTALALGTGLSGSRGLAGSLSLSPWPGLSDLTQLILYPGIVTGSVPPQIGQLRALQVISMTNNRLTGPIPPALSNLKNLHTLDLSNNRLSGSIPPALAHLPALKVLVLASNVLSGALPSWSASAQRLLHLDVKANRLSGALPAPMPPSLRYLSASNNDMWGPLNGLLSLSSLVYLDLSMNQFGGPIPSSLFRPSLSSLLLQRNNLSGGVPLQPSSLLQSYGEGSIVDLSHNFLTGELSAAVAGVETLFLNNNRLMGRVPVEYVKSVCRGTTRTLYLQHNYISEFPLERGVGVPDTASLCLSYNCMDPVVGLSGCPASAGDQLSRPSSQCQLFKNGSSGS